MSDRSSNSEWVESAGTTGGKQGTVAALNELLRDELAAIHSYEHALTGTEGPETKERFQECARSHRDRAAWLRAQVLAHGGEPAAHTLPWGVFALAGKSLGVAEKMAVVALAEGEEHNLRDYREALPRLDTSTRTAVSGEMLPEQLRTFDMIIQLKSALAAPPIKWWR